MIDCNYSAWLKVIVFYYHVVNDSHNLYLIEHDDTLLLWNFLEKVFSPDIFCSFRVLPGVS